MGKPKVNIGVIGFPTIPLASLPKAAMLSSMNETPLPLEQEDPELAQLLQETCQHNMLTPPQGHIIVDIDQGTADYAVKRSAPKVGRNDPCPCGSGKKHKKCCGG